MPTQPTPLLLPIWTKLIFLDLCTCSVINSSPVIAQVRVTTQPERKPDGSIKAFELSILRHFNHPSSPSLPELQSVGYGNMLAPPSAALPNSVPPGYPILDDQAQPQSDSPIPHSLEREVNE